jgi:hypothetical protein
MTKAIAVLISSRNRPLYLWACLDALYRGTQAPHRFILVDMASTDPLVAQVIHGFDRRGMFDLVLHMPGNDPALLADFIFRSLPEWAPAFAYVESDVVVEVAEPCWLSRMTALMQAHPALAMLGSAIDRRDFVDPVRVAALRRHESEARWRALIKADSPERLQDTAAANGKLLFRPHNPAGRLLMLRTDAVAQVGLAQDGELDLKLRQRGYETAIATQVRHRHLSLAQVYDYPDYDLDARDRYMAGSHQSRLRHLSI